MNTLEAIKTRRSTRKFKAQPVEIEKLKLIAEAGQFGPTGGNAQGNHFFVISDAAVIAKLKELVQSAFAAMELREDLYKSLKNSITLSARAIILSATRRLCLSWLRTRRNTATTWPMSPALSRT